MGVVSEPRTMTITLDIIGNVRAKVKVGDRKEAVALFLRETQCLLEACQILCCEAGVDAVFSVVTRRPRERIADGES